MKLTKDMFDFEKYDYFAGTSFSGKDQVEVFHAGAWVPPVDGVCTYELSRKTKPPPRYILLNEGEPLKPGDELLEQGHTSLKWGPPADHIVSGNVEPGEIWRRKVQE